MAMKKDNLEKVLRLMAEAIGILAMKADLFISEEQRIGEIEKELAVLLRKKR